MLPLICMCFALFASSCEKDEAQLAAPADLLDKDWYYDRQPESSSFKTYTLTPVSSRGVDAFRFETGGAFVLYTNAPNDAGLSIPGTWTTMDGQKFHIKFIAPPFNEFDLLIKSLTPSSLQAKKTQ